MPHHGRGTRFRITFGSVILLGRSHRLVVRPTTCTWLCFCRVLWCTVGAFRVSRKQWLRVKGAAQLGGKAVVKSESGYLPAWPSLVATGAAVARHTGPGACNETGRSVGGHCQKSAVSPASGSEASSTRCGQSAAVMSQKRHSCLLGTRLAGWSADSRRMSAPRFCMNASSMASAGTRAVPSALNSCVCGFSGALKPAMGICRGTAFATVSVALWPKFGPSDAGWEIRPPCQTRQQPEVGRFFSFRFVDGSHSHRAVGSV